MQIVIMYLAVASRPKGGQGPNFHTQYVQAESADVGGRGQIYSVVGDKRSDIACTRLLLLFRVTTLVIGLITIVSVKKFPTLGYPITKFFRDWGF